MKATIQLQRQRNGGRFISELSLVEMLAGDSLLLDEPAQHLLSQIVTQLPLPGSQEKYLHQVARTTASMSIANPIWDEPVTHVQSNHLAEATCMRPARYWNQESPTSDSSKSDCTAVSSSRAPYDFE